jgi:hypothetical protein
MSNITSLLNAIPFGDRETPAQLLPLVYGVLRKLAAQQLTGSRQGSPIDCGPYYSEKGKDGPDGARQRQRREA